MTAPDRIIVRWTTSGEATVATPALHGPIADTAGVYVLETRATPAAMTPGVAKLVEAAQEYIDELEWHYGGGETDLGRKYRAALAALRAGGDA